MANKDPNDYLQKGQYGLKQTLPDERRKFLGSLRERTYLVVSLEQIETKQAEQAFTEEFKQHPDGSLLLNGTYDMSTYTHLIQLSKRAEIAFTFVANEKAEHSPYAAIFTAAEAVNEPLIQLDEKYPLPEKNTPQKKEKKKSFFKRFFS